MSEAALEVTRDSGARHATLGPGPDGWGRRSRGGWWPPQRPQGPARTVGAAQTPGRGHPLRAALGAAHRAR